MCPNNLIIERIMRVGWERWWARKQVVESAHGDGWMRRNLKGESRLTRLRGREGGTRRGIDVNPVKSTLVTPRPTAGGELGEAAGIGVS
jgi:hypothetical protein